MEQGLGRGMTHSPEGDKSKMPRDMGGEGRAEK